MKLLISVFLILVFTTVNAPARALLGALNTPLPISTAYIPYPAPVCPVLNNFGYQNSQYLSRNEIFKSLKLKSILMLNVPQNLTTPTLQVLRDQFMQATSVFKNNFDLDANSPAALVQTRARLLGSVGYNEKRFDQGPKAELIHMSSEEPRWKNALLKLTCNIQACKALVDTAVNYDLLVTSKSLKKDLEVALLDQASESITVDEMLGGQIIPSERARLRLFSALLSQLGVQSETRWNCNKTSAGVQFSSRIEVKVGNDTWASDTALSSDYTQKSTGLCFSSLTKLTEVCSAKKGASL